MRLVSSIDAGKESHQDSASMLEGDAYWPLHIERDRLSRHASRLLNAGGLSQRQTWASRFAAPWLFVYVPQ